jgi:hypothetical protein
MVRIRVRVSELCSVNSVIDVVPEKQNDPLPDSASAPNSLTSSFLSSISVCAAPCRPPRALPVHRVGAGEALRESHV